MTSGVKTVSDIEVDENQDFLRRDWRRQRVGWVLMLLVVLAALAGLFGRGPLANASVGTATDPVRLEYERLTRYGAPTQLQALLSPEAFKDGTARVWMSREFVRHVEIEKIVPEPDQEEIAEQNNVPGILYSFRAEGTGQPARVQFHIRPTEIGTRSGQIGLAGRSPLSFQQFVFP